MKLKIRQVALLVAYLSLPLAFAANASNDSHAHDASGKTTLVSCSIFKLMRYTF